MAEIRPMRAEEIPFGLELCRIAGWNQLVADWERLLALDPEGVFIAEEQGTPCGTASAVRYGTRLSWIGMVLVHPDFRRRGIGSALMAHCIQYLQQHGVESIKLDATDQGRPVYLKLGFRDERPCYRMTGARPDGLPSHPEVRPIAPGDWPKIAEMDRAAFDADRLPLLRILHGEGPSAVIERGGELQAYGFARLGFNASYLGPLVSRNPDDARAVAETLLAALPAGSVYWDILPDNAASLALVESYGFQVIRQLTRMVLGASTGSDGVAQIYGAARFELG